MLLIISSCCKDKKIPQPDILKGKIRKIESYILNRDSFNHTYYFMYDSIDGMLQKVMYNNRLLISISKKQNNCILMHYNIFDIDTSSTLQVDLKAYFNNDGYINEIVKIDSITHIETDLVQYYLNNGYPDSIQELPFYSLVTESSIYNFQFQENNIVQADHSYDVLLLGTYFETSSFFYNSTNNRNKVPTQYPNIGSYYLGYAYAATEPIYLLGLNGYFPFKPNANLVDSISVYDSNHIINNRKYNYTYNSDSDVSKLFIDGPPIQLVFEFEYY